MKAINHATFNRMIRGIYNKALKNTGKSLSLASLENHAGILEVSENTVTLPHDWVEKLTEYNTLKTQ